jgi:hypothetical protein
MVLADEALGLGFKLEAPEENGQGMKDPMERLGENMYQGNTLAETLPPDMAREKKSKSGPATEQEQDRDR